MTTLLFVTIEYNHVTFYFSIDLYKIKEHWSLSTSVQMFVSKTMNPQRTYLSMVEVQLKKPLYLK